MPIGPGIVRGAAVGSQVGGALGTVVPGIGTAIGAAVGTGAGALAGALQPALAGKGGRAERKMTFADVEAMRKGQLGLTTAEKRQAVSAALSASGQQVGAAQREVARDSLAGAGTGVPGQYVRAQQALGGAGAEAGANAMLAVDEASRQQAEARRQEILSRLGRQTELEGAKAKLTEEQGKQVLADTGTLMNMFFNFLPEASKDLYNGKAGVPLDSSESLEQPSTEAARQRMGGDSARTPMTEAQRQRLGGDSWRTAAVEAGAGTLDARAQAAWDALPPAVQEQIINQQIKYK